MDGPDRPGKRRSRKSPKLRIDLRIDKNLLKRIDEAAKQDSTTRSDLIRVAVMWFLMPQHRGFKQDDKDYVRQTIEYRKRLASYNKWFKEHGHEIDPYDG